MQNFTIKEEDAINLGQFLKKKREEKEMTIIEIEAKSGINRADIYRIENGQKKRLNPFQLISLAETLEVNLIELYILVGFINKDIITDFVKKSTDERINEQLKIISYTGAIKIPIYKNFLEGFGIIKDSTPIKYTTLFLDRNSEYIGVVMNDNSLSPFISKDSIVIVEKTKELYNNQMGVFRINGDFYVRKYLKKNSAVILYAENSSLEPIIVDSSDEFTIYGKAVVTINEL